MLLSDFPKRTFCITDFGAFAGEQLQTAAIQSAIDACFLAGGGRVVIPAGVYRTGGLRLRSGVALYLQSNAVLQASTDPEDYSDYINDTIEPIETYHDDRPSVYPYSRWNNAIIRVIQGKNVAIVGEENSCIDGGNCYDPQGEEGYRGPHGINIQQSENVLLEGYTLSNSANWAHAIFNTKNIVAKHLTVLGGHDGFDVRSCDDVLIDNCAFYTGDDCVAGFDNCNVVIRDCIMDCACSAMRFGGNHVLVENCRSVAPSRYGFRGSLSPEAKAAGAATDENCRHSMHTPFKYYCDFRAQIRQTPGDILIRNCEFINPDRVFQLEFDGKHKWCCNRSLSSITFQNCSFTGVSKSLLLYGDKEEPIDFTLENVTISAREGFADVAFMEATNYRRITMRNVTITGYTDPTAIMYTKGELVVQNTTPVAVVKRY